MDPQPVDFRPDDIKELTDSELFYIIANGIDDTAMMAWGFLDEERRWQMVNYYRSFQE